MKSTNIKILITSSIFLIIIGAAIFFGVYPEMNRFSNNQAMLSETKAKLIEADYKLNQLNDLSKNQASIDETKKFVDDILPDDKNTSDFVVKAEALTDGLSVIIESFTTSASTVTAKKPVAASDEEAAPAQTQKKQENSVEFNISMNEGFSTVYDVIMKLESFPRFNVLDSLYFSNFTTESNKLDFRAKGRIFYGK